MINSELESQSPSKGVTLVQYTAIHSPPSAIAGPTVNIRAPHLAADLTALLYDRWLKKPAGWNIICVLRVVRHAPWQTAIFAPNRRVPRAHWWVASS
jgi:hypothetical protein